MLNAASVNPSRGSSPCFGECWPFHMGRFQLFMADQGSAIFRRYQLAVLRREPVAGCGQESLTVFMRILT